MLEEEKKLDKEKENHIDTENQDENNDIDTEIQIIEDISEEIDHDDDSDVEEDLVDLLDEDDLEELKELTEELGLESDESEISAVPLEDEYNTDKSEIIEVIPSENSIDDFSENDVEIENSFLTEENAQDPQNVADSNEPVTVEIKGDESQPDNEQSPDDSLEVISDDDTVITSENEKEALEGESMDLPVIDPNLTASKDLTEKEIKRNVVEAAMFIAGRPISIEELSVKLSYPKKVTEQLVYELAMQYQERTSSIEIVQIGDSYSLQIKAEYTNSVKKFASGGLIPEAAMRTLTVIALKQPISKAKLVKMRGSGAYQHVKFLTDRGFLSSYKKGRSSILETNDQFSDQFGLSHDTKLLKQQLAEQLGIKSAEQIPEEQEESDKGNTDKIEESLQPEE